MTTAETDPRRTAFRRDFTDYWGQGDPPGTPADLYDPLADAVLDARRAGRGVEVAIDEMVVVLDRLWGGRLTPRARARLVAWLDDTGV